jgi:HD-GYP domain-containing protein (c-di-GMP phosphodiesterase class II)
MLSLSDFDPAGYSTDDLKEWYDLQSMLEDRISRYAGEFGLVMAAHHMRVAADALGFLMFLGYSDNACRNIKSALMIHDIGKTHDAYDPAIWTLPDRPTDEQRVEKRLHTKRGVEIIDQYVSEHCPHLKDHPHVQLCRLIALYHHERLNGSLYENMTDLPEWMQAICILDTYDGDRIKRPHQEGRRSPEETIQRMMAEREDGEKYEGAFNPELMKKFGEYKL